jgi:cell division septation protein DedD
MDKVLKQRLVGASILIALAVIFLPMLFEESSDAPSERELTLELPERPGGDDGEVRRLPLDPDAAREPEPTAETRAVEPPDDASDSAAPDPSAPAPATSDGDSDPMTETDASTAEDAGPGEEPASEPDVEPPDDVADEGESEDVGAEPPAEEPGMAEPASPDSPPREAAREPPERAAGGRWVVQVAVFSSRETAAGVRERLEELGHRVASDVLVRDQTELHRLRTGPYADEGAAEQARGQIEATVAGVDPVVRELDTGGAGEDRAGLSVQVGSFASRNNADRLTARLRSAGYDAFMHGEESAGRTIWRVRVGSFAERADADALLERLRDEEGLEGIVVSHP